MRHQVVARVVDAYQAFEDKENRLKAPSPRDANDQTPPSNIVNDQDTSTHD